MPDYIGDSSKGAKEDTRSSDSSSYGVICGSGRVEGYFTNYWQIKLNKKMEDKMELRILQGFMGIVSNRPLQYTRGW